MVDTGEGLRHLATWVARGAFAGLALCSSYAAVLSKTPPPPVAIQTTVDDARAARVIELGDRLSNIEGKLDVMEKLDIGLILAMGGQLFHLALTRKRNRE